MIIDNKRSLAHIQKVSWVKEINGADNIELIGILGWTLIAKKGEFNEGDKAVFIEIDSQVPDTDRRFAFLESKHYKVKTYKLNKFGVVSQGLALPLTSFPELGDAQINTDVTEALHITYAVKEDNTRKAPDAAWVSLKIRRKKLFNNPFVKWLSKYKWGKKLIMFLWGRKIDKETAFPSEYCSKTDEERIQNMPDILQIKMPFVATEKIDGTSSTYVLARKKTVLGTKYEFIVSSRNVRQVRKEQKCFHEVNVYWEMAEKYDLENRMRAMLEDLPSDIDYVVLQGETYGEGLQGNKYKMKDRQIAFFNFIDSKNGRWPTYKAMAFLQTYDLPWVPIIGDVVLPDTVEEVLELATGSSTINKNVLREGYVFRMDDISFKAVSPAFLLKHKE